MTATAPSRVFGWRLSGWWLVGGTALFLSLAVASLVGMAPEVTDGLRQGVRLTARSSFALFLLAYTASSLAALTPCGATRWQRRNRRFFGLSFALSHLVHGLLLIALAQRDPALFWSLTNVGNLVSGGVAYGFILLMAATSFPWAVAALGGRWWGVLHRVGVHYLWISFLVAFGKRAAMDSAYTPALVLLGLALLLRGAAWWVATKSPIREFE
jgi:methionine sulfoxide reductase heme-binding subunit